MKQRIIPVMIGILITLFNLSFPAEQSKKDEESRRQFWRSLFWAEKGLYDGRIILKVKDKIGLTEEQEQRIENLMLAYDESTMNDCAEIKVLELRFASYVKSAQVDREEIKKLIKEISERKTDSIVKYLNYLLDLKEILSADQFKKMKAIHDEVKKHHSKKRAAPPTENGPRSCKYPRHH